MYMKPSMQVVELQKHHLILCCSNPDEGYIPNMRENMNVFVKPDDQNHACMSFGMARKRA